MLPQRKLPQTCTSLACTAPRFHPCSRCIRLPAGRVKVSYCIEVSHHRACVQFYREVVDYGVRQHTAVYARLMDETFSCGNVAEYQHQTYEVRCIASSSIPRWLFRATIMWGRSPTAWYGSVPQSNGVAVGVILRLGRVFRGTSCTNSKSNHGWKQQRLFQRACYR